MAIPTINDRSSPLRPAGEGKSLWRATLEAGANLLQDMTPLKPFDVYVVGFHCARDDAGMQMEAHHFCRQVNGELIQCVIFDGNTKDANLIGIEYIVSERLFETLDADEQRLWHPHNYEILSGQLIAPGLPGAAEKAFLKLLMNSYGKTWHTWHTGRHDGLDKGTSLPTGPATLMWSFNRDGECDDRLRRDRVERMGIDEGAKREQRQSLVAEAHPQRGEDAMAGEFLDTKPVAGVVDAHPDRP